MRDPGGGDAESVTLAGMDESIAAAAAKRREAVRPSRLGAGNPVVRLRYFGFSG
ncbi:MAG: hypothetical protein AAB074_22665 [Planctomycetota bacterium]